MRNDFFRTPISTDFSLLSLPANICSSHTTDETVDKTNMYFKSSVFHGFRSLAYWCGFREVVHSRAACIYWHFEVGPSSTLRRCALPKICILRTEDHSICVDLAHLFCPHVVCWVSAALLVLKTFRSPSFFHYLKRLWSPSRTSSCKRKNAINELRLSRRKATSRIMAQSLQGLNDFRFGYPSKSQLVRFCIANGDKALKLFRLIDVRLRLKQSYCCRGCGRSDRNVAHNQ